METVEIWTDGACDPNPGRGGWAWYDSYTKTSRAGSDPKTTNNRMELMAAIDALQKTDYETTVIVSDSQYLVLGINERLQKWFDNGKFDRRKVMNEDLWFTIWELMQTKRIKARWVRGHSGILENEAVDVLAKRAMESYDEEVPFNRPV